MLMSLGVTAAATLAGCSQNTPGESGNETNSNQSSNDSNDSSVFANVESVAGEWNAKLRVTISEDTDVDKIGLYDSNGVKKQRKSLGAGSAVEFALSEDLPSGAYDLVATTDGTEVERQSVELDRSISIQDVRIYAPEDHPSQTFELDVTNTGDFRLDMTNTELGVSGDVPNPERKDLFSSPTAFVDSKAVGHLSPGQEATLRLSHDALQTHSLTEGDLSKGGCSGEKRVATMQFNTASGYTKEIKVEYTLSGEPERFSVVYGCSDWAVNSWEPVK